MLNRCDSHTSFDTQWDLQNQAFKLPHLLFFVFQIVPASDKNDRIYSAWQVNKATPYYVSNRKASFSSLFENRMTFMAQHDLQNNLFIHLRFLNFRLNVWRPKVRLFKLHSSYSACQACDSDCLHTNGITIPDVAALHISRINHIVQDTLDQSIVLIKLFNLEMELYKAFINNTVSLLSQQPKSQPIDTTTFCSGTPFVQTCKDSPPANHEHM